jgi:hypothetical protein
MCAWVVGNLETEKVEEPYEILGEPESRTQTKKPFNSVTGLQESGMVLSRHWARGGLRSRNAREIQWPEIENIMIKTIKEKKRIR